MAGYSSKPLVDKLGIRPGHRVAVLQCPRPYTAMVGRLPPEAVVVKGGAGDLDLIHLFTKNKKELAQWLPKLRRRLRPAGALWISWPKGSSGVLTDLNENHVREAALAEKLVDVKVCAVDDVWSGLKLVIPVSERPR